jgi:hypothetical protein
VQQFVQPFVHGVVLQFSGGFEVSAAYFNERGRPMNGRKWIARITYELTERLHETPYDIFVPRYDEGQPLQPVPQVHFQVTYADDADDVIREAASSGPSLEQLMEQVRFKLDLKRHVAHVFIAS